MIVVITDAAERDLERISDWIGNDNPHRAETFVRELVQKCLRIAHAPRGYAVVPRFAAFGIRRRTHGNYLIFYRIRESIEIVHVLHAAQDWGAVLEREL